MLFHTGVKLGLSLEVTEFQDKTKDWRTS